MNRSHSLPPDHESFPQGSAPALIPAMGFGLGIALDAWLTLPAPAWFLVAGISLTCWFFLFYSRRFPLCQLATLLLGLLALGGARHHQFWSLRDSRDISLRATDIPQPVWIEARVVSTPQIRPKKLVPPHLSRGSVDRTVCLIECRNLLGDSGSIPVSGTAQLIVSGHLLHAKTGDRIEVQGQLFRPRTPGNPGEFDYRTYLRRQGALCLVVSEHPNLIQVREHPRHWNPAILLERGFAKLRSEADLLMVESLGPRTAPVASALFLGDRTNLEDDLQEQFLESGTLHLLAISGLHVGIFSMLILLICRLVNMKFRSTCILLLGVLWFYAGLTQMRPSVARATILISLLLIARLFQRRISLPQALSIAALIILWRHPCDLFNAGAQLSFLAVIGIVWVESLPVRVREETLQDKLDQFLPLAWWRGLLGKARQWLVEGYKITGAIWLFTAPLVMWYFHIISPVGLVINVLLMPLLILILGLGYLWLVCAVLVPWLSSVPAWGLNFSLSRLLQLVDLASAWNLGHIYAPAPPVWWLCGYYGLLISASLRWKKLVAILWSGWLILGLVWGLFPQKPEGLRVTFIDVGHGCSVLVECPNGRTLLYDAGSLNHPDRTRQIVQGVLWSRGIPGLDALLISHADIDHFNAVPEVLESVPVKTLFISPQFQNSPAPSVRSVLAPISSTQLQTISAGTVIYLDDSVRLIILHPGAEAEFKDDNEASLVLLIEYAGNRILLTGDVEKTGWSQLSAFPIGGVDVFQSPHHGSLTANTPEVASWANARIVIASAGHRINLPELQTRFGSGTQVRSTSQDGAITITISPVGDLRVDPFRKSTP